MSTDLGLYDLAATIGELPGGDTPAAWYASMDPTVLTAYDAYLADQHAWNTRYAELLALCALPPATQYVTEGSRGHLLSLVAPPGMNTPPRWLKWEKGRKLVPRKRTTAERTSRVRELFTSLEEVPRPIDYLPGMPKTLIVGEMAYAPQVRRPAQAVLVFLAAPPEQATTAFETDPHWARMKLSSFHQLKERQQAAAKVR